MTAGAPQAPVRVLLAVGDPSLEARLTRELPAEGFEIAGRCLDAPTLVARAAAPGVDVVLAAADLHRLDEATLTVLRERRRPVLVLTREPRQQERLAGLARFLPASSSSAAIAAALRETEARGAGAAAGPTHASAAPAHDAVRRGRVVAVTSGKGAPGKTTVAIACAAVWSDAGSAVILVDADLGGGNIAPALDLDPRHGLVGLAVAPSASGGAEAELQDGPGFRVLAGIERLELADALRGGAIEAAVATLRTQADVVVVDAGAPADAASLRAADAVLVVTGPDLIAIWNARLALPGIRAAAAGAPLGAVVNRREGREHYDRDEIERALGVPVLGVIREDRRAARRAIERQAPLSAVGGRAARDVRALATAVAEQLVPPDVPASAPILDGRLATEP